MPDGLGEMRFATNGVCKGYLEDTAVEIGVMEVLESLVGVVWVVVGDEGVAGGGFGLVGWDVDVGKWAVGDECCVEGLGGCCWGEV